MEDAGDDPGIMSLKTRAERAERRYLNDKCTITRPVHPDALTLDANHRIIDQAPAAIYSGPCLISQPSASADSDRAGEILNRHSLVVRLPHDAPEVLPDDVVAVDETQLSPGLVRRTALVESVVLRSMHGLRALSCTLVERVR